MTIRLYFDEDSMRDALVKALRARGVDVATALEVGMIDRDDAEHLDYALTHGRVLCSFNVGDFYDLRTRYLSESKTHAGIVPSAGSGQAWRASRPTQWVRLCVDS